MSPFLLASFLDISPTFGKRTKPVAVCSKMCFWIGEPQLVSCFYSGLLSRNPTLSKPPPTETLSLPTLPQGTPCASSQVTLGSSQLCIASTPPYPGRSYLGCSPEHRDRQGCMKPRVSVDHQGALEQLLESLGLSFLFGKLAWSAGNRYYLGHYFLPFKNTSEYLILLNS